MFLTGEKMDSVTEGKTNTKIKLNTQIIKVKCFQLRNGQRT